MSKKTFFQALVKLDTSKILVSFSTDQFLDDFVQAPPDSYVYVEDAEGNQFAVKKSQLCNIEVATFMTVSVKRILG